MAEAHLVDELSIPVVILEEGNEHMKTLSLVEDNAALVITQESL